VSLSINLSTKTGDKGQTSLANGQRVAKCHRRVVAVGGLDELNSWLGLVVAQARQLNTSHFSVKQKRILKQQELFLIKIQRQLFQLGAVVALVKNAKLKLSLIEQIEVEEKVLSQCLTPAWRNKFVLPGGSLLASQLDVARTVCRRTERSLTALLQGKTRSNIYQAVAYLNRLADYLYLLKRYVNQLENVVEELV